MYSMMSGLRNSECLHEGPDRQKLVRFNQESVFTTDRFELVAAVNLIRFDHSAAVSFCPRADVGSSESNRIM